MASAFLSFDFYGAGNLGDDLMLAGFLGILGNEDLELRCATQHNIESQRTRFPRIEWLPLEPGMASRIPTDAAVALGVGDTPVQIRSGRWMLDKLLQDAEISRVHRIPNYWLGVGVEAEALEVRAEYWRVLDTIDHVWTRDRFSRGVLVEAFNRPGADVTLGADLANIELRRLTADWSRGTEGSTVGLCFFPEDGSRNALGPLREALALLLRHHDRVEFCANETRPEEPFESWFYGELQRDVPRHHRERVRLEVPDYGARLVADLVQHFRRYDVLLSCRYHSLLAGAWAGCRVAALPRSSKVDALADDLGLVKVPAPVTARGMMQAASEATGVERAHLEALAQRAERSVRELAAEIRRRA